MSRHYGLSILERPFAKFCFSCKTNCLIWFVSVNLISTINLHSWIYSCFKHFPTPSRSSHSKEVEQSNNFPFQALFHVCKDILFKVSFKLTVTIEVIQDNNRHILSSTPNNKAKVFISKDMRNVLLFQKLSDTLCNIWC